MVLTSCSSVQISVILQQAMQKVYIERAYVSLLNVNVGDLDKIAQHIPVRTLILMLAVTGSAVAV